MDLNFEQRPVVERDGVKAVERDIKNIVKSISNLGEPSPQIVNESPVSNSIASHQEKEDESGEKLGYIPFYKLQNVCFPFQNQGYCLRGDRCKFDHFSPKICPCIEWSMGDCSRGDACRFAHIEPKPELPEAMKEKFLRSQGMRKQGPPMNSHAQAPSYHHQPARYDRHSAYRPRYATDYRSAHEALLEKEFLQRRALEREAAFYRQKYFRSFAQRGPAVPRIQAKVRKVPVLNPEAQEFTPTSQDD